VGWHYQRKWGENGLINIHELKKYFLAWHGKWSHIIIIIIIIIAKQECEGSKTGSLGEAH
jgi:hypothetical protein